LKSPESSLDTEIIDTEVHRPGLALAGFMDVFSFQRIQIIGTSEWTFLEAHTAKKRTAIFERLKKFHTPLWIVTNSFTIHPELLKMCDKQNVPVISTPMPTMDFCTKVRRILEEWFAPFCTVHGTLVDVYGVGMLYTGKSGVGKSECALDLIERGHRLVELIKSGDSLIGMGNRTIGHHMEIRGLGIVEVGMLFGIRAVRDRKKVEIIVELQHWEDGARYDRTGLDEVETDIMGISVPKRIIPISPGKNITVISEVIAMSMLLKMNEVDVPKLFNEKLLKKIMAKKKGAGPSEMGSAEIYE
jgi:HPr kinase/phosphorylase